MMGLGQIWGIRNKKRNVTLVVDTAHTVLWATLTGRALYRAQILNLHAFK